MRRRNLLLMALVVTAAIAAVPGANAAAPTLHFAATGSSAMFQQFGISVVNEIAAEASQCAAGVNVVGGCAIHHFTIKGTACADSTLAGTPCVGIKDARSASIPPEAATFWAIWVCPVTAVSPQVDCNGSNATDVWYYDQADSTIGVRTFLGQATTIVAGNTKTGADAAQNLLPATLLLHGDATGACGGPATCDATEIPADVYGAINTSILNTGMTVYRPEDALFATKRANSVSTLSPWTGLGYGGGPNTLVGASIQSAFSTAFATPVAFGLPGGTDPFTSAAIPNSITVFSIGESPIVFITNRSNAAGLGSVNGGVPWYNNVVDNAATGPGAYVPSPIGLLFGGTDCNGSNAGLGFFNTSTLTFTPGLPPSTADFAVNPILYEPISGTGNTAEFSVFRTFGGHLSTVGGSEVSNSNVVVTTSTEAHLVAVAGNAPPNPLNNPCANFGGSGLGTRKRAVGATEEIGKPGGTGIGGTQDSIGYAFFSFANLKPLGNLANYGYLLLDGVDPIFDSYTGGDPGQPVGANGLLPVCNLAKNGTVGQGCENTDVWTSGNSFPNLRNGTYRSWSVLRAMCDTNAADAPNYGAGHCTFAQDALGTEGIIRAVQDDIHNNDNHSVADFLPFSDDGSFGPAGGFGDAKYIRSHYAFNSAVGVGQDASPSTHITPSFQVFPNGLNADQANGTGSGGTEAGGDAGGCIIPVGAGASLTSVKDTNVVNGGTKMKFDYTALGLGTGALTGICGPSSPAGYAGHACISSFDNNANGTDAGHGIPGTNCGAEGAVNAGATCNPPASGLSVAVTGFPSGADNKDNGVFQVTRILFDGQIKVRVAPTSSTITINPAPAGVEISANNGCSQ